MTKILVVDDIPDNVKLLESDLLDDGYEVVVAYDVIKALEVAAAELPDVILMDMQMPTMDGYEATGHLRNRDYQGPIIALTANAMASDRDKCLRAGCDEYASKPVDRVKLINLIRRFLEKIRQCQLIVSGAELALK